MRYILSIITLIILLSFANNVQAATYYCSGDGSNANNGLSQSSPWRDPPGLGSGGTGWTKLYSGDNLIIKRGTTLFGLWKVSPLWYADGSGVEVADNWGTGSVTLTGNIWLTASGWQFEGKTGDVSSSLVPTNFGMVVNVSAGGEMDCGFLVSGNGNKANHILFSGSNGTSYSIVQFRNASNTTLNYVFVDGLNSSHAIDGILFNEHYDNTNITLNYCYAGNLGGSGSYMPGNDNKWIGFWGGDQTGPLTFNHCISFNNGGRGWDFGGLYVGCKDLYFNYCGAINGHASGFGLNSEDGSGTPKTNANYNYCVALNNVDWGYKLYQVNGDILMNNCLTANNGAAGILIYGAEGSKGKVYTTKLTCRDSIFYNNHKDIDIAELTETTQSGPWAKLILNLDYNAYWGSTYLGGCSDTNFTYGQKAAWGAWVQNRSDGSTIVADTHSLTSSSPGFVGGLGIDGKLDANSSLINAGTTPNHTLTQDYFGLHTPLGQWDIGIHEVGGTPETPPSGEPTQEVTTLVRVPVILYHSIGQPTIWGDTSLASFTSQMGYLATNGYTPITIQQLRDIINGVATNINKPIMICFDDAYGTQFTNAWPVLLARSFHFVVCPPTGIIGTSGMLSYTQLQTMLTSGLCEVGDHTVTHAHIRSLSDAQAYDEIHNSKLALETNLTGETISSIAWPYEEWETRLFTISASTGLNLGFSGFIDSWTEDMKKNYRLWLVERQYISDNGAGVNCTSLPQFQLLIDKFGYQPGTSTPVSIKKRKPFIQPAAGGLF